MNTLHLSSPLIGKTALVTGGLGFLGSALARALVAEGAHVRILDSLLPQGGGNPRRLNGLGAAVDVVVEDTRSRDIVNHVVAGCDLVFHCAGSDGVSAPTQDWYSEVDIACVGTLHVLDAARVYAPQAHVVFASASSVYGPAHTMPVSEDAPTTPRSLFAVHKLSGEHYCSVYRAVHGVRTTSVRLAALFGPGQRLRGASIGTVAHLIDAARRDEPLRIGEGARHAIDALFVEDAARALVELGSRGVDEFSVVNVGSGEGVPAGDFAAAIVRCAGLGRIETLEDADSTSWGPVLDTARFRALVPTLRFRSLDEALSKTLAWYQGDSSAA